MKIMKSFLFLVGLQFVLIGCVAEMSSDTEKLDSNSVAESHVNSSEDNEKSIIQEEDKKVENFQNEENESSIWFTYYNANYDYSINITNRIYKDFWKGSILFEEQTQLKYLLHEIYFSYEEHVGENINKDLICGIGVSNDEKMKNYKADTKDLSNGPAILHTIDSENIEFINDEYIYGNAFVAIDTFSGINFECEKGESGYQEFSLSKGYKKNLMKQSVEVPQTDKTTLYKEYDSKSALTYVNNDYNYKFEIPLKWTIETEYRFLITSKKTEESEEGVHSLWVQLYDVNDEVFDILKIKVVPAKYIKETDNLITKNEKFALISEDIEEKTHKISADMELDDNELSSRCYFVD